MNRIILVVCVWMLASCTQSNQQENNSDSTANVADSLSDSALVLVPDTLSTPPQSRVELIRTRVEEINRAALERKHFEFECDVMTTVDYFYLGDELVKITVDFGTLGDVYAREDYYYDKGEVVFMYEFVEGGPACEGCIKKNEYRYYIDKYKVFRYLKDGSVAACRKCEFGPRSRQYRLLTAKNESEVREIICR